jgi:hypothetical protein
VQKWETFAGKIRIIIIIIAFLYKKTPSFPQKRISQIRENLPPKKHRSQI